MKQRDRVVMTADEIAALLAESRKLQLATINPDGTPHLVTMFYVMLGGRIVETGGPELAAELHKLGYDRIRKANPVFVE